MWQTDLSPVLGSHGGILPGPKSQGEMFKKQNPKLE